MQIVRRGLEMGIVSRWALLRRSQLCAAIYSCERELLALGPAGRLCVKPGSKRDSELRRRRAELLDALRNKDAEILAKWERGFIYGQKP